MSNPVFEFLNGKRYVLNGVSGTFKHEEWLAKYPYPRMTEALIHQPDEAGKQTSHYQEQKRQFRDDWVSDLTQDVEGYCQIAFELGYVDATYERLKGISKVERVRQGDK